MPETSITLTRFTAWLYGIWPIVMTSVMLADTDRMTGQIVWCHENRVEAMATAIVLSLDSRRRRSAAM